MFNHNLLFSLLIPLLIATCDGKGSVSQSNQAGSSVQVPVFNADSAYAYVKAQTDFGPRIPNTKAHKDCADYLAAKLKAFGAETIVQPVQVTTFDGTKINGYNIIGQYKPESPKRVLICSHWDSRPWADNDPDPSKHNEPVMGANDGASGVGVILEIARQMQKTAPEIGIDCIFFDAEDWGPGDGHPQQQGAESFWALGTQYWARQPHKSGYMARYAVLLDMVGGQEARFYQEGYSLYFAESTVKKFWSAAKTAGFGNYFPEQQGGYVTDDHVFINRMARIPAIDIIPYYPDCKQSGFGPTWHTVTDDIEHIDKATLKAVGQTLLQVIYNEN